MLSICKKMKNVLLKDYFYEKGLEVNDKQHVNKLKKSIACED